MELTQIRTIVVSLKETLRENNVLMEDVQDVYMDCISRDYVIVLKPKTIWVGDEK